MGIGWGENHLWGLRMMRNEMNIYEDEEDLRLEEEKIW